MISQSMSLQRFCIGDFPGQADINFFESGNKKLSFASSLQTGNGAFVRRSDNTWRYAVVKSRSYGVYASITFIVEAGDSNLTKTIKKKDWCHYICKPQDLSCRRCGVVLPGTPSVFFGENRPSITTVNGQQQDDCMIETSKVNACEVSKANASDFSAYY